MPIRLEMMYGRSGRVEKRCQFGLGMMYGRSGSGGNRDARSGPGMTYLV